MESDKNKCRSIFIEHEQIIQNLSCLEHGKKRPLIWWLEEGGARRACHMTSNKQEDYCCFEFYSEVQQHVINQTQALIDGGCLKGEVFE